MKNILAGLVLSAIALVLLSTPTVSLAEDDNPVEELEEAFSEQLKAVEESFSEMIEELEEQFSHIIAKIDKLEEKKEGLIEAAEEITETLGELEENIDEFREDLEDDEVRDEEWTSDYTTWVSRIGTSFELTRSIGFSASGEHVARGSDSEYLEYERDSYRCMLTYTHKF